MNDTGQTDIKAIRGGTLIDGTGAKPSPETVVLIEGPRIKAVGRGMAVPAEAEIIDAAGKTVMPGLIDSHVHFFGARAGEAILGSTSRPAELGLIKSIYDAKDLLAAGFTTAKDCGSRNGPFLKKAVEEGTISGLPRIIAAGYWLSQTFGHFDIHYLPLECVDVRTSGHRTGSVGNLICDGVDECIKATRYALREGADFIKICTTGGGASERDKPSHIQFNFDEIKAIVDTAAQVGKFVSAHCELSLTAMKQSILGGVRTLDHAWLTDQECIELAMERGITFVSTLAVLRRILDAEQEGQQQRPVKEEMRIGADMAVKSYKLMRQAGAPLAIGTDITGAVSKFGANAIEIELLVKYCDFSPMEAIMAATRYGAMACFMGNETGTIEVGKYADIIILDGDPLQDIRILQDISRIKTVMLEGRIEVRR